jgi:hypothetical protein
MGTVVSAKLLELALASFFGETASNTSSSLTDPGLLIRCISRDNDIFRGGLSGEEDVGPVAASLPPAPPWLLCDDVMVTGSENVTCLVVIVSWLLDERE